MRSRWGCPHCASLDRRALMRGGLAALSATLPGVATAAATRRPALAASQGGCALYDDDAGRAVLRRSNLGHPGAGASLGIFNGVETYDTSGDTRLDRAFGLLLADIARRFKVRPGFVFYDDSDGPNAFSSPVDQVSDTKGTVLFGRTLLRDGLAGGPYGDMFVMSICAHEFGHIVQYFSPFHDRLTAHQSTSKLLELHADFLAGYYLGVREERYSPQELVSLGQAWETIGDTAYTAPLHHGAPEERLSAIETAFKIARERPEFGIDAISEVGARYLGV